MLGCDYVKNLKYIIIVVLFSIINTTIHTSAHTYNTTNNILYASTQLNSEEKRGNPTYDYIFDKYNIPHFRVYFWVPKTANNYYPYADDGIKTEVSDHGPIEKWSITETGETNENEKLVFIYVPKRFIFKYGIGFEKLIHLNYD